MFLLPSSSQCIAVALKLDETAPQTLSKACLLAEHSRACLCLIHVVEPMFPDISIWSHDATAVSPEVMQRIYEQRQKDAEEQLNALVKTVPKSLKITIKTPATPFVTEGIMAEATSANAKMILCAIAPKQNGAVPRGFSTALSLMANANIPVLAFKTTQDAWLDESGFRVMVADDCRDAGLAALRFACELSLLTENCEVAHVHVNRLQEDEFKSFMQTALTMGDSSMASVYDGSEMYARLKHQLEEALAKRMDGVKKRGAREGLIYKAHLLTGDISTEIARFAHHYQPHVILFGRHMTLRRKPFGIGALPYRTMLQQDFPIMVVPPLA